MQRLIARDYLESNVYEFHSRGWKAHCPDCGGHNLYYTEDNGFAFCFNCNASYRISGAPVIERNEAPKDISAIRACYGELANLYHGCLPEDSRAYLNNRGIDDVTIDTYRLGYCPSGAIAYYRTSIAVDAGIASTRGVPSLAERITVPYVIDGEVTDIRGRATKPNQDPKYKSLFGASERRGASYPFNWERAVNLARVKKYIIITEGEFKALVADRFGFPCVALPGMASWRRGFIAESDWRVVVVFDAARDRGAQRQIDRAIAKVHERIPTVYVGMLPLLGEDKQDLDSFLLNRRGGAERLASVVDNAVTYKEYARLRSF